MTIVLSSGSQIGVRVLGMDALLGVSVQATGFNLVMDAMRAVRTTPRQEVMSDALAHLKVGLKGLRSEFANLDRRGDITVTEIIRIGHEIVQLVERFESATGMRRQGAPGTAVRKGEMPSEQDPALFVPGLDGFRKNVATSAFLGDVDEIVTHAEGLAFNFQKHVEAARSGLGTVAEWNDGNGPQGVLQERDEQGSNRRPDVTQSITDPNRAALPRTTPVISDGELVRAGLGGIMGSSSSHPAFMGSSSQHVEMLGHDVSQVVASSRSSRIEHMPAQKRPTTPASRLDVLVGLSELSFGLGAIGSAERPTRMSTGATPGKLGQIGISENAMDPRRVDLQPVFGQLAEPGIEPASVPGPQAVLATLPSPDADVFHDLFFAPPATSQVGIPSTNAQNAGATQATVSTSRLAGFSLALADPLRNVHIEEGATRVQLSPKGLGTIEIEVTTEQDRSTSIVIRSDNPAVLSSMRDAKDLLAHTMGLGNGERLSFEARSTRRSTGATPGKLGLIGNPENAMDPRRVDLQPVFGQLAEPGIEPASVPGSQPVLATEPFPNADVSHDLFSALPATSQVGIPSTNAQNAGAIHATVSSSRLAGFSLALADQLRNVHIEEGTTRVQLSPKGLGAIEIEVTTEQDRSTSIVIRSDNPVVLSSMRDARDLLAHIMGLGNGGSLSFEERSGREDRGRATDETLGKDAREIGASEESGPAHALSAGLITDRALDITT